MTPKTITAILPSPEGAGALGAAGAALAERWDAHLTGLHALPGAVVPVGIEISLSPILASSLHDAQTETAREIRSAFETAADTAEWREIDAAGDPAGLAVSRVARAADLLLVAQEDRTAPRGGRHLQEAVLRGSGRPVLMVAGGAPAPFSSALIGWADTREAARAAFDLLPLLEEGAAICLLSVGEGDPLGHGGMADMAASLGRRGFDVTAAHRPLAGLPVHEAILREARDCGAAVMAIGGYGHSPAWHFVNGAVTNPLLDAAPIPVLLSR